MGENLQYLDIILLAMVAGFVALRLRSVLGKRNGDEEERAEKRRTAPEVSRRDAEQPTEEHHQNREAAPPELPQWTRNIDESSDLGKTLSRIMVADRNFNPDTFVEGARSAYEMIVEAYAEGNREMLKSLLSPEIYDDFDKAIAEREEKGQTMAIRVVDIEESEINSASLEDDTADITMRFVILGATAVRDKDGNVISGNVSDADRFTEVWTFSRNLRSADPNWLLVDTNREE